MSPKPALLKLIKHPLFYLILAAAGLRFFRIEFRSIWLDEAYSLVLAASDWKEIVQGAAMDIHPPLFHLILGGWIRLFGTSEFALRAMSAIAGTLLVPIAFISLRDWGNRQAAWWGAGLIAFSPYFIELSRSGRMASLLILFCAISLYFFWRVLQKPNFINSLGYCLAMLAAMYTHYFAFLVFASQHIFVFMGIGKLKLSREIRKNWLLLQTFLLIGFSPWFPTLWDHLSKGGPAWRGVGARWWEPLHALYAFWAGTACWDLIHKIILGGCVGGVFLIIAWRCSTRMQHCFSLVKPRVWGLLATLIIVPLGLVWGYSLGKLNVFDSRYLSMSALGVMFLCAILFSGLNTILRRCVVVLLLIGFSVPLWNQYFVYGYYDNWRQVVQEIEKAEHHPQSPLIAVYPAWNATPLNYYLKERIPIQGIPGNYFPVSGRTENFFHIEPESIDQLKVMFREQEKIWLVLVNEGREQTLVKEWFQQKYHQAFETQRSGIYLIRFDRKTGDW